MADVNKRQTTPKGQPNMNNPERETGHVWYTRRLKTKQEHNAICVGYHYGK